ncbi:hypothetical protein [Pararhizobium sp. DWP3-4]|uniref:hypothetical protein n=1 Tax=Pararhizobium sp. DWP3-4 TaxID=2804565 RepID=UPI003CF29FCD
MTDSILLISLVIIWNSRARRDHLRERFGLLGFAELATFWFGIVLAIHVRGAA